MRQLIKNTPVYFTDFVTKSKPLVWDDFRTKGASIYDDCYASLKKEQNHLSGYTEKPLPSDNRGVHIDHFRKRSLFPKPKDVFDWNNLILDEHNVNCGADYKDAIIKTVPDNLKLIDPISENPHLFFTYMLNGHIKPQNGLSAQNKDRAEFTINAFNLNHPSLCEQRKNIIRLIREYKSQDLSDEDIMLCMEGTGFTSTIEYALET